MSNDVQVKGLADLQRALDQLPAKIEANVMRSALRQGANVIKDEAKAKVPVHLGALRDSIRVSTGMKRGTVKATIKAGDKKAWYWRFVEFGTKAHWIKPKNKKSLFLAGLARETVHHPGARAKPFMRPALDARAHAAIEAVGEAIRRRLATKHGIDVPAPEKD